VLFKVLTDQNSPVMVIGGDSPSY